jgi:hypothetical protein
MSQASVRKAFIKTFGLPSDGKTFMADYDGNVQNLSGLQVAIDEKGDPELSAFWDSLLEKSDGTTKGLASTIHGELYPGKKSGIRNKQPDAAPEKMEGTTMPASSTADSGTLGPTPYESLSDADKQRLTAGGFPASDIGGWTADDLQLTLNTLDKQTSKGKSKGRQPAAPPKQAAAATTPPAAATPPAATTPQRPVPTDPNDPIPGAMGITQSDLDAVNDPIPGPLGALQRYGLTREDALRYADSEEMLPAGIMGEPSEPPAMDMGRLAAAATPSPMPSPAVVSDAAAPSMPAPVDPLGGMTADQILQALGALDYAPEQSVTPMSVTLPDAFSPPPTPQSGILAGLTGDDLSYGPGNRPQPKNPWTSTAGMEPEPVGGPTLPPPTDPETSAGGPYRPVTSRVDAFMKARGLEGMNTGAITKPMDFVIRNSPWIVPAAVGAYGLNKMFGGSSTPPQTTDEATMQQLEQMRDQARANMEATFGGMSPPTQPMQPQPKPQRPTGRSL